MRAKLGMPSSGGVSGRSGSCADGSLDLSGLLMERLLHKAPRYLGDLDRDFLALTSWL
jgi:hypothetical protein